MPIVSEPTDVWNRELHDISPRFKKLIHHASRSVELHESGKIKPGSFLLADLTDLSFPYKKPKAELRAWERSNGRKRIVIQPGAIPNENGEIEYAYPYGSVPRLFLIWLTTEIKHGKSRTVEVGKSITALRKQLGIADGGKQHENFTRQLEALFASHIVIYDQEVKKKQEATPNKGRVLQIAESWEIWKSAEDGEIQQGIPSTLQVTESFYQHAQKTAVPLVPEIVDEFKRDPMRLDIYCWLVHRLYMQRKSESNVSWSQLVHQFGGGFTRERDFKHAFKEHLQIVRMYYPEARISVTRDGLILRRSKLHIPSRGGKSEVPTLAEVVAAATELDKAS